jgi:hypothetical protein
MILARTNTTIRPMLIAALVINTGSAPTVAHAHSGGEQSHDHQPKAIHSHNHADRDADHHHPHVGHEHVRYSADISSAVLHVHVSWFGFDITVPIESGNNRPDVDSMAWGIAAILKSQQLFTIESNSFWSPQAIAPPLPLGRIAHDHSGVSNESRRFTMPGHVLLCDTARLERSGVRII